MHADHEIVTQLWKMVETPFGLWTMTCVAVVLIFTGIYQLDQFLLRVVRRPVPPAAAGLKSDRHPVSGRIVRFSDWSPR